MFVFVQYEWTEGPHKIRENEHNSSNSNSQKRMAEVRATINKFWIAVEELLSAGKKVLEEQGGKINEAK